MENINNYIEHLQEMGKTDVSHLSTDKIVKLQIKLKQLGYNTSLKMSDRDYLIRI